MGAGGRAAAGLMLASIGVWVVLQIWGGNALARLGLDS